MQETYYKQYELIRKTDDGLATLVTWLPERFKNAQVKPGVEVTITPLEDKNAEPTTWIVKSVSGYRRTEKQCKEAAHKWAQYADKVDI